MWKPSRVITFVVVAFWACAGGIEVSTAVAPDVTFTSEHTFRFLHASHVIQTSKEAKDWQKTARTGCSRECCLDRVALTPRLLPVQCLGAHPSRGGSLSKKGGYSSQSRNTYASTRMLH